jgi:hypothetical protein
LGVLSGVPSRHDDAQQLFAQALGALRDASCNEVALAQALVEQGLTKVDMGLSTREEGAFAFPKVPLPLVTVHDWV